jgi:uncharacterized protein (DUF433 family)
LTVTVNVTLGGPGGGGQEVLRSWITKMGVDYDKIITVEPGKRGGRPTIRGMRITVYDVLSYLAAGMTHEEILRDFPYLTEPDILACLAYAADRERRTLAAHG